MPFIDPSAEALRQAIAAEFEGLDEVAEVLTLCFFAPYRGDQPTVRRKGVHYNQGDEVVVAEQNGVVYKAIAGGVTGPVPGAAPVIWLTNSGDLVVDGGVTWTCLGPLKKIRGVPRHVLLEGLPGTGKSEIVEEMHKALIRLFFTENVVTGTTDPVQEATIDGSRELLPSDFIGREMPTGRPPPARALRFVGGPLLRASDHVAARNERVMSRMVFVDELNRISEKTLSALLKAMAQNRIQIPSLIARPRQALCPGLFLVAAQNPPEQVGVGAVPEAVVDRFMVRIPVPVPDPDVMDRILQRHLGLLASGAGAAPVPRAAEEVELARRAVRTTPFPLPLIRKIAELQKLSRPLMPGTPLTGRMADRRLRELVDNNVLHGFGVRGAFALGDLAQTYAWANQSPQVTSQDLRWAARYTLNHRIRFRPGRQCSAQEQVDFVGELCMAAGL